MAPVLLAVSCEAAAEDEFDGGWLARLDEDANDDDGDDKNSNGCNINDTIYAHDAIVFRVGGHIGFG